MKVPVKDPTASPVAYNTSGALPPVQLSFKNEQSTGDKTRTLTGTIPMNMVYQDKPFDAVPWIAQQTVKEMTARGLPVTLSASGTGGTAVLIKRMHIDNYRASGFSPFVTFTLLSADVETPGGLRHITAYVKRGKVPVWSFDEVIDPTYNDALSILTKELAAKLNSILFHQIVSNDQINALIAKIEKENGSKADSYLDVYQLGFGNNPIAIPELVKLSTHSNEYVRLAAVSSLGILKAKDQLNFLISRYESTSGIWQDRAMALKAIGDLDTPEGNAYLEKQQDKFEDVKDKEARWTKELVALYLHEDDVPMANSTEVATNNSPAPVAAPVKAAVQTSVAPAPAPAPVVQAVVATPARPTPAQAPTVEPTVTAVPAPQPRPVETYAVADQRASAPVSPPTPVAAPVVAQQPAQTGEFQLGTSSSTVERLGRQYGCESKLGAGLVTEPGPVENYQMTCLDGKVIVAHCELRQCSIVQ